MSYPIVKQLPTGHLAFPGFSAIGNVVFTALNQPGPLLTQEHDDDLEQAMPSWWTSGATFWLIVCVSIEQVQPAIMTKVAVHLRCT